MNGMNPRPIRDLVAAGLDLWSCVVDVEGVGCRVVEQWGDMLLVRGVLFLPPIVVVDPPGVPLVRNPETGMPLNARVQERSTEYTRRVSLSERATLVRDGKTVRLFLEATA